MAGRKLTGRVRHRNGRTGFFGSVLGVMILQVEHTWPDGPTDSNGMPSHLAGQGWRDATAEDLSQLKITGKLHGNN